MQDVELLMARLASIEVELHYAAQLTKDKELSFQVRELAAEVSAVLESIRKEYYGARNNVQQNL